MKNSDIYRSKNDFSKISYIDQYSISYIGQYTSILILTDIWLHIPKVIFQRSFFRGHFRGHLSTVIFRGHFSGAISQGSYSNGHFSGVIFHRSFLMRSSFRGHFSGVIFLKVRFLEVKFDCYHWINQ